MLRGATILLFLAGVISRAVSAPPEPDPKTYGYITTFQVVDEEDLPANTKDLIKMEMNQDQELALRVDTDDPYDMEHDDEIIDDPHDMGDYNATAADTQAVDQTRRQLDSSLVQSLDAAKELTTGKKCVQKVMMREETRYEEVMTCDHSYDERCHTSYVTSFQPDQEEDCEDMFRKVSHHS